MKTEITHYIDGDGFNYDPMFLINDPEHELAQGWYFEDECRVDYHGPFTTFEECLENLNKYGQYLLNRCLTNGVAYK
jgi:hypothetical protein